MAKVPSKKKRKPWERGPGKPKKVPQDRGAPPPRFYVQPAQVRHHVCPTCGAAADTPCTENGAVRAAHHAARVKVARLPGVPRPRKGLDEARSFVPRFMRDEGAAPSGSGAQSTSP